jgi:hypothetical protein
MDEVSAEGAEAAAVYFLELFPYVFATGDLEEWRALSHPECIYCASVVEGVEEMVAADHHSEGGLVAASEVHSTEADIGRWWLVTLTLVEQPSSTLTQSGQVVDVFPDVKTYATDVAVIRERDWWLVREVTHRRRT